MLSPHPDDAYETNRAQQWSVGMSLGLSGNSSGATSDVHIVGVEHRTSKHYNKDERRKAHKVEDVCVGAKSSRSRVLRNSECNIVTLMLDSLFIISPINCNEHRSIRKPMDLFTK